MLENDVTIIGAGPAGISAGIFLAQKNIPVTILEKNKFPRDKICGDCLGGYALSVLKQMGNGIFERFIQNDIKMIGSGVHFFGPEHQKVSIEAVNTVSRNVREVALCRRFDFDNFLVKELNKYRNANILENKKVVDFRKRNGYIEILDSDDTIIKTKLVILATGSQHALVHKIHPTTKHKKYIAAGIRSYLEGVEGLAPEGYIELHFLRELAPGYLWIFPLPGNLANVGLGLRSDMLNKRKISLKQLFEYFIKEDPYFKKRFKNAKPVSETAGFPLALGGKKRSISGDGYLLAGDSANLIEPLFGEGIGHAMYSGKFAAEHAVRCLTEHNFSSDFNARYDREVYGKLGPTLKFSAMMQKVAMHPRLMSLLFNRVNNNDGLQHQLFQIINGQIPKKRWQGMELIMKMIFNF